MSIRAARYVLLCLALLGLYGCPSVRWAETYLPDERNPFDLYALYELMEARPQGLTPLRDSSHLSLMDSVTGTNYVFIGYRPFYEEEAVTGLLNYVERGNDVFLAAYDLPEDLAYHLFGNDCYYKEFDDYVYPDYTERFPSFSVDSAVAYRYPQGDSFHLANTRYWEPGYFDLTIVNDRLLCDTALDNEILGVLDTNGINFLRLGWGKGNFYFHSNPLYFTNWYVLDSVQYRYPEAMLSVIAEGPVFWDEYHRRYRQDLTRNPTAARRNYDGGRNLLSGNETLLYIQERRELALAWYTLLCGALLYVIFRGRRRQRIIPVIPERENSSRRFIDTVSRLVFEKGNHAALAQRELAGLRFHLNQRLGLGWAEGQPPPEDLHERAGLSAEVVERAVVQIRVVSAGKSMQEGDLLRFYRAIEPLYRL